MLGRKIIEVYPDENAPEPDTTSIGKDNNSLPVRRLRSAGLRIITENDVTNVNYLQVPNARRRRDSSNSGGTSILTPDTTHTFGLPNPTSMEEDTSISGPSASLSDVSLSSRHDDKRQRRYSQQETALKTTFQASSREPSYRDLQLRALERATAMLDRHAKEAQDRANKLRAALTQRDGDPDTHKTLQRERWMEERRSKARSDEAKALQQLVLKLRGSDYAPAAQRTQSLPGAADMARQRANLLSFSEKSPTKVVFTCRRGTAAAKQHAQALQRSVTINEARPMRLRTTAPGPVQFPRPAKTRTRTKSLQTDLSVNNSRTGNSPLERGGTAEPSSPPFPLVATPMAAATGQAGPSSAALGVVVNDGGVATIYATQQPRTREQIDSDMTDVTVGLPSYALDLLGELDDIHGDITLTSSSSHKPPPLVFTSPNGRNHVDHLAPPPSPNHHVSYSSQSQHSTSPPRSRQPTTPPAKAAAFGGIRPRLSFVGRHKHADSVSSGGPGSSVRMSGEGVVLAERPSTPVGSISSLDKPNRWNVPTPSPAKALSKMKNRLSMIGGKRS